METNSDLIDMMEQNSIYCTLMGVKGDDLDRLKINKFPRYMTKYDNKFCEPIESFCTSFKGITPDGKTPPDPKIIVDITDTILRRSGPVEYFIREMLPADIEKPKPGQLYECFAKAVACLCCIQLKLFSGGDPSETVKPYLEESEVREKAEEVKTAFFKSMEEIGYPIKEGHGDIKTFLDERRVKGRIDVYVWNGIKRVYNVRDC